MRLPFCRAIFWLTPLLLGITLNAFAQSEKINAKGLKMYKTYQCESCHGKHGNQPFDLTQAIKKYDKEKIQQYIRNPREFGNQRMPAFESVIKEDYEELIRYVIYLGRQSSGKSALRK
jgi:mono/diheme cytochrome c family protein